MLSDVAILIYINHLGILAELFIAALLLDLLLQELGEEGRRNANHTWGSRRALGGRGR